MTARWPFAACVSLCLLGVIAWELRDNESSASAAAIPVIATAQVDGPAKAEPEGSVPLWLTELNGRPLFRRDRRPQPGPSESGTLALDDGRARLTGVIIGPTERRAIFLQSAKAKQVVVQEGDRVGVYVVRSLQPGQALVDMGGTLVTLVPSFADGRSPAAPSR